VSGQPVTRVEGRLKVTGKALYAADNPAPGLVYAALVCSTVARGSVERIDPGAAVRYRDVLRVLTDFGGVKLPYDIRQVSCFGQPVAVVVGTTIEAAMHGAALVEVKYRPGPQLTNIDAPQAEQKPGSRTRDYARGTASNCGCATNPTAISPITFRSPPAGSPTASGRASPRSAGHAATPRRAPPGTAAS
jgi:xanthine dehydrogenase YagR molybdenum-binding subunit